MPLLATRPDRRRELWRAWRQQRVANGMPWRTSRTARPTTTPSRSVLYVDSLLLKAEAGARRGLAGLLRRSAGAIRRLRPALIVPKGPG
jgi:hypothetical protein